MICENLYCVNEFKFCLNLENHEKKNRFFKKLAKEQPLNIFEIIKKICAYKILN